MRKRNLAEALGSDTSSLAQIVRSKGRGRDTILAHITPREAAKLKREGGRGSINPETGLPEFEDSFFFDSTPISSQSFDFQAPSYTPDVISQPIMQAPTQDYTFQSSPEMGFKQPFQAAQYTGDFQPYTGGDSWVGSLPGQYAGGVVDGRNLLIPNVASDAVKADLRAPQLTAADISAQRGYYTTPQGVDTATTDQGVQLLEQQQSQADEGQRIAAQERARIESQARGEQPAAGAGGAGVPAPAGQPGSVSSAIASAGIDVTKLSTSDMSRLNQVQSLVNNGTMTLEQAQAAIANMAQSQSFTGGLTKWLSDPTNSLKLALGIGAGAMGLMNMSNAKKQAADVQAQMQNMANQYRQAAQPFMTQGGQQYGLATQGALTQANQQQFDVARAQLAQSAARSGSVGAMQATQIAEQIRQNALNNQLTQGLQILAAGNTQMGNALSTELQALNTRLSLGNQASQAANGFYTQLAALFGGARG